MYPVSELLVAMGNLVARIASRITPVLGIVGSLFLGIYHFYRAIIGLWAENPPLGWFGKIVEIGLFLLSSLWNLVAFIGMAASVSVMVFHPLAFVVLAIVMTGRDVIECAVQYRNFTQQIETAEQKIEGEEEREASTSLQTIQKLKQQAAECKRFLILNTVDTVSLLCCAVGIAVCPPLAVASGVLLAFSAVVSLVLDTQLHQKIASFGRWCVDWFKKKASTNFSAVEEKNDLALIGNYTSTTVKLYKTEFSPETQMVKKRKTSFDHGKNTKIFDQIEYKQEKNPEKTIPRSRSFSF